MKMPASLGHHGVQEWYIQRLTAIVLLLLLPAVLWLVIMVAHGQVNQTMLQNWLASPFIQLAHSLFAVAVLLHGYIGLKIIMEDYLHQAGWRMAALAVMQVVIIVVFIFWLGHIWF